MRCSAASAAPCRRAGSYAHDYTALALALGASLSLLLAQPAFAHHPGAPGNGNATGPINTLSATTPEKDDLSFGLAHEGTSIDALSDDTLETAAEHAAMTGHAHVHSLDDLRSVTLSATYGLSDDFALSVRAPYLMRDGVRTGHFHGGVPEVENEGGASGIGDIAALLQWRVMRGENTDVSLFAGREAPTGEDDAVNDLGDVFAAEFQPGSGSWDFTAGAAVTRRAGHWSFDASGLYTFAGENDDEDDLETASLTAWRRPTACLATPRTISIWASARIRIGASISRSSSMANGTASRANTVSAT